MPVSTMTLSAVFYALAYLTGCLAFLAMARSRRLATSGVFTIMQAGLIGGLIVANIAQWLFGGTAGKTVLGGIAGGYFIVFLFKRMLGIRRPLGDLFAVAICAGEAVGRLGCFFGGCCYGKPSNVPWHIWQHEAYRHPTQLYLSFSCLLILALLWGLGRRKPVENTLFYAQGILYCLARFIIEFFRVSPPIALGLTIAQWACLIGLVYFAVRLAVLQRVANRKAEAHAVLCPES
jgi:phosphatidylglycerol:prolipoprotein diacylglycerol transferase